MSDSAPPNLQYYRFGAAESDTEHRWLHTGSYYHSVSTFNIYYKSVVVPDMYAETPQCQIRRRRICSTTYSALPNLTLSIAGCIQGLTIIQYQLLTSIISQ